MNTIDNSLVGNNMKLWMYNSYVILKLSCWLIVCDLSLGFTEHLQSLVLPFLKKWSGHPRPANPTILFSSKCNDVGLKLKTIPGLWKQLQVVKHHPGNTTCRKALRISVLCSMTIVVCARQQRYAGAYGTDKKVEEHSCL